MNLINIHWVKIESLNALFDRGFLFTYSQGLAEQIKTRRELIDSIKYENVWVDFDKVNTK